MVALSPFQEFNLCDEFGPEPNAFLHVFGGQTFAPSRAMPLWKIHERTFGRHKGPKFLEYVTPRSWHKTVADARHIDQDTVAIEANDDGIEAVSPWHAT